MAMTNTRLLKAKMALYGDTIKTLGEGIGLNRQNASYKINGKRDFRQGEMDKIAKRYNLSTQEIRDIFFSQGA